MSDHMGQCVDCAAIGRRVDAFVICNDVPVCREHYDAMVARLGFAFRQFRACVEVARL
jgi:hypothetical protein